MFNLKRPFIYFSLFAISLLTIRLIAVYTVFPELIFPKINSLISRVITNVSGNLPISIGDILYFLLGILILVFVVKMAKNIYRKNWQKTKKLTSLFFIGLTSIMLVFHFFWGFNYYKKPIKTFYNVEEIHTNELKLLAEFYLKKSIETRKLVKENENGVFQTDLHSDELAAEILNSTFKFKSLKELRLRNLTKPNLKKSFYSTGFSYAGVLGYYNPFTGEAQFNSKMPDTKLLFTKFHETAHQWGFASESEANFVGFLIGMESENPSFRYVANYKALRSLLNKIVWEDPAYVELMLERYSPAMQRDRAYELKIQKKYLHRADDAFSVLNEAYLQLNNQDGLESYGQFVELLVGFHRKYVSDL